MLSKTTSILKLYNNNDRNDKRTRRYFILQPMHRIPGKTVVKELRGFLARTKSRVVFSTALFTKHSNTQQSLEKLAFELSSAHPPFPTVEFEKSLSTPLKFAKNSHSDLPFSISSLLLTLHIRMLLHLTVQTHPLRVGEPKSSTHRIHKSRMTEAK